MNGSRRLPVAFSEVEQVHMAGWMQKVKSAAHRWLDPLLVVPGAFAIRRKLADLPDGAYHVPMTVPYVPQFASPEHIYAYIHEGFHGRDDPAWESFGAPSVDGYDFWARRVCALACLKMAVAGFDSAEVPTLWQLVEQGLQHNGYRAYSASGVLVDEGWFYPAIVALARDYGLGARGYGYAPVELIYQLILDGWMVAPSVTPELGEHGPLRCYGGHMVLVHGFRWEQGQCTGLILHNPSGRFPELRANAEVPAARFRRGYAHRLIAFRIDSP